MNAIVQGFLEGEKIIPRNNLKTGFDGKKLDILHVMALLKSREDVDELLDFLTISKFCFDKTKP